MKKFFLCIFITLFVSHLNADYYSDWNSGYSGIADIEYIGRCSQEKWDSGDFYEIVREHFPHVSFEIIEDSSAAEAYLLIIALTGRAATKAEMEYAESLKKVIERYTYWNKLDKIDNRTKWLMEKAFTKYDIEPGEVYKTIVNYSIGFIVRIESGNNSSYRYSYYAYEKEVIDE
jgi:hypothetical protein